MHWRLLFCDFVSVKGKNKYGHVLVVLVLVLDIFLNSIIGLTPYIDNYNRTCILAERLISSYTSF